MDATGEVTFESLEKAKCELDTHTHTQNCLCVEQHRGGDFC